MRDDGLADIRARVADAWRALADDPEKLGELLRLYSCGPDGRPGEEEVIRALTDLALSELLLKGVSNGGV